MCRPYTPSGGLINPMFPGRLVVNTNKSIRCKAIIVGGIVSYYIWPGTPYADVAASASGVLKVKRRAPPQHSQSS